MTNSRSKGKRGELELCQYAAEHLGLDLRRGQQYSGASGDADVVGWPGVHIEAKRYARHACLDHWRQAQRDAGGKAVPVAALRENGDTDWYCLVRLRDLPALAELLAESMGRPIYPPDTGGEQKPAANPEH